MKKPAFNTIAIILIVVGFRSMAISSPYPWESIYIEGDQVPVAIDFNKPETISGFQEALAVYLDMGRKLTEKEITRLKSKMKIIDQKGTASNNGCSGFDLSKMGGDFIGDIISFLEMFEESADAVL